MKFVLEITRQKPSFAPLWAREAVKPNNFLKLLRGNFSFRRNIAAFEYERNRKIFRSFYWVANFCTSGEFLHQGKKYQK